jgi:hypothetical protein
MSPRTVVRPARLSSGRDLLVEQREVGTGPGQIRLGLVDPGAHHARIGPLGQSCLELGKSLLGAGDAATDDPSPAVIGQRTVAVRTEVIDSHLDAVGSSTLWSQASRASTRPSSRR